METKDLDGVFAEANDVRPVTAKQALGMIAKSLSHVANPETSDDDARDAMSRVYAFTKAAHSMLDVESESDEIAIEKALVEAVEADGADARPEPVSRAVDAIRKRFDGNGDDATGDDSTGDDAGDATGDDATGDAGDGNNGGSFDDRGVQWHHDLNADPDPEDDWGTDPSF
jgi:hypothetical protein